MKNFNSKIVCLLFILASSITIHADNETKSQLVISLTDPAKPGFLKISGVINGSIKITGYEGKEVVIEVVGGGTVINKKNKENTNNDGMKRISGGGLDITAEEKNNHVEVNVGQWMQSNELLLNVKIPRQFNLNLSIINGEITVEEVKGQIEATNVNGNIIMNNVSGSVVANTVNENIIVTFKEITVDAPMAFSTVNGNLDVTFPANMKASIKLKSEKGEIFSNFDIDMDKSEPKVERSADRNWVKMETWISGKINGGGPEVLMKNMQGNIYLRKAK